MATQLNLIRQPKYKPVKGYLNTDLNPTVNPIIFLCALKDKRTSSGDIHQEPTPFGFREKAVSLLLPGVHQAR